MHLLRRFLIPGKPGNLFLVLFFVLVSIASLSAQTKIQGRVTDTKTGEPVPFANVFFANTTIGTITDDNGNYALAKFPAGKYDLTVSFVGYSTFQVSFEFQENQSLQQDVRLQQQETSLDAVVINADTTHRKRDLEDFKRLFLGTNVHSAQARIVNVRDIYVYFDPATRILTAHAQKPIIIENNATGYRIHYHLKLFEYDGNTGVNIAYGIPQFEIMKSKSKLQEKRWEKNRRQIYYGSMLHFMRSWLAQQWTNDGFTVSRMYRLPNKNRPPEEVLRKKIAELRAKLSANGKPIVISDKSRDPVSDSLSYYLRLRSLPTEVDSVANEILTGAEFTTDEKKEFKAYNGFLRVQYKDKEHPAYAASVGRPNQVTQQHSNLLIMKPLSLYSNGYYEDVRDTIAELYWSWTEKVPTLLPLDYEPQEEE